MNYIRELLYRPKRSDKSLMAKFYFADLNLNAVASELDSFDGRKDPERCSCLVNRLRVCQDRLLSICNKMLEEIDAGYSAGQREFRAKFPDDIMTDNLAGQLWFGAECLAAGSSIMHKEDESDAMRPLARAVTKSLEKVRVLLREQCLSPQPEYTEKIRETIKIFDRLFAEFEYSYVQCMVHVKTIREYELHQDLIILFSETLDRAIQDGMVTRDMVDFYEPSLMFAIPRLAIVHGLLVCPEGPLNVDRSSADFPELFLPFKNLLRKIRELLLTLAPSEVSVLQMLLCQQEEPANISVTLKEMERKMENREKSIEEEAQAKKLQDKLSCEEEEVPLDAGEVVAPLVDLLVHAAVERAEKRLRKEQRREARKAAKLQQQQLQEKQQQQQQLQQPHKVPEVEIDCTGPEPEVKEVGEPQHSSSYSPRPRPRLKRHNAKRDSRRIPLRYQKDRRSKFKSTEDLLHRLYVCISGAADQLQSNYAGDFRAILKNVFVIHASRDDEEDEDNEDEVDQSQKAVKEDVGEEADEEDDAEEEDEVVEGAAAAVNPSSLPTSHSLPSGFPIVDLGTDALQHQISERLVIEQLAEGAAGSSVSSEDLATAVIASISPGSSAGERNVYARNLGLQMHDEVEPDDLSRRRGENEPFYQPEPTLLDIASGVDGEDENSVVIGTSDNLPHEAVARDGEFVRAVIETPPAWLPDDQAPNCMGCGFQFTIFRRRHHCRNCGLVFCNRCSSHSIPLPRYGMDRPVRVCNRCNVIYQYPDIVIADSPEVFRDESGGDEQHDRRGSPWNRNFGMVS